MRAFIAVDVPATPGLREALAALRATGAPLKVVDPAIVHVTLKFLGEVPEERVGAIVEVMRGAAATTVPGRFALRGLGAFPGPRRPRVVWVGIEPAGPLVAIAEALEEGCARLGFPREGRPFTPHATLARAREPRAHGGLEGLLEAYRGRELGEFTVDALLLKRSTLRPTGPVYDLVARVPLQPAG